jgi:serine protease Do
MKAIARDGRHDVRGPDARRRRWTLPSVVAILAFALLVVVGCTSASTSTTTKAGAGVTPPAAANTAATTLTGSAGGAGPTVASQGPITGNIPVSPAEQVSAKVGPSVVNVRVSGVATSQFYGDQPYQGVGSGVIISSDGYIVTNNHVVSENGVPAQTIDVLLSDGETVPGKIVARDSFTDLAVIKINKTGLPVATFAKDTDVVIGEYAIAIGSPLDYRNSVTLGIVSGMGRNIQNAGSGGIALVDLLQTDAAISPGNSGGALVDASGRVIGINVAYLPPQQTGAENIGFAIPADTVVATAQQLISTGKVSHPYIGINYTAVDASVQQQYGLSRADGVLITQVGAGTPAEKAGLQQGDIIIKIDGQPVTQEGDVVNVLRAKKVGDTISVVVDRNGKQITANVALVERPASAQ